MTTVLYHHTDTGRLPWIIEAGELRPGRNKIGGLPDPDLLWATSDQLGDRTASGCPEEYYRRGKVLAVRIVLNSDDFVPWAEVSVKFPAWTRTHVETLERTARGRSDPSKWWCRADPLRLRANTPIETRSFTNNRWTPLADRTVREARDAEGRWLAISIGPRIFHSRRITGPHGQSGYEFAVT